MTSLPSSKQAYPGLQPRGSRLREGGATTLISSNGTSWVTLVPALPSANRRRQADLLTGYNPDSTAHIVRFAIYDGSTRWIFHAERASTAQSIFWDKRLRLDLKTLSIQASLAEVISISEVQFTGHYYDLA